jgi:hypothetical protein
MVIHPPERANAPFNPLRAGESCRSAEKKSMYPDSNRAIENINRSKFFNKRYTKREIAMDVKSNLFPVNPP